MNSHSVFIVVGIACGLAYAALGITAIKHMPYPKYFDKYVGWSLWWFLERDKYGDGGKKYCTIGTIVAFAGWASWVLCFMYS